MTKEFDCISCKHAIFEERSATNSRVIGCDCRQCEEDKCRYESDETDRALEDNRIFERQQGKVVIQNAEHIVNIDRIEVFNA